MMRAYFLLLVASSLFPRFCQAVFADDAWNVDYQLALLGLPQEHTTFFHQPASSSKASLLYTLSERNVLGAVNPKDGTVVWRQHLSEHANSTGTFLRAGEGQDVIISAVDGEVAAWSASDGRQAWTSDLKDQQIYDLEILELDEGKEPDRIKDAVVLFGSAVPTVRRIDGLTGHVKWQYKDESGDVPHQVSATTTEVHYIALHTTMLGGHKIRVTSLDPTNGRKTGQYTLSSESEVSSAANIVSVGANSASPIIAWTDKSASVLKVNVIGTKTVSSFNIDQPKGTSVEKVTLHAPFHISSRPHFLVHYQTADQHWAEVYHVDIKASSVSKAYNLPKLAGKGAFSTSSSDANVYFTRVSETEVSVVSSVSHGVLARWALKPLSQYVAANDATPVHAVSELSVRSDSVSAARSAVLLSSGEWILIRDDTVSWQRPESLAHTVTAVWAYPQAAGDMAQELEKEAHSTVLHAYIHRLLRHLRDLEDLPEFLADLPSKLLHSLGSGSTSVSQTSSKHVSFGFLKRVVCATSNGRLIALEAGNRGSIAWNIAAPSLANTDVQPLLHALADGTVVIQVLRNGVLEALSAIQFNSSNGGQIPLSWQLQPASVEYSISKERSVTELVARSHEGSTSSFSGMPLWRFCPKGDDEIISIASRPADEPVASIGKVMGDRRVLYKYLNPNLVLVATKSDQRKTISVTLVDSISGDTLHSVTHKGVDTNMPFASTVAENWFAYSLSSAPSDLATKGFQLVVGEFYESAFPDDRGPMENKTGGSFGYQPYVVTQTYTIAEPISHMTVSQTQQGITSKDLLVVLPHSDSIVGIPRPLIDPRRPVGRDSNKDEAFEGLMKYNPILDFDPKWYLNHKREVIGTKKITTSPAILESSSLIFAYGLDIFGTRISPSFSFDMLGKDFNKLQMLATVAALFVGTLIVAPIVMRKQVNTRWQFT